MTAFASIVTTKVSPRRRRETTAKRLQARGWLQYGRDLEGLRLFVTIPRSIYQLK